MPTYEYRCGKCGEAFEVVCSMAEREKKAMCPSCGSRSVRQVFGSIAFSGHRSEINPGHFERPRGRDATPRWVEPKR